MSLCIYCVSILLLLHLSARNTLFSSPLPPRRTEQWRLSHPNQRQPLISRGESVVVNCTYEAVSPSLFWYVQFPSQPPRLFLRDLGREDSDEGIRKGFDATHDKKHKSFHLWKPSSELSDSGTYY
ncbi:T-cell receptor alpha chain V region RL-5 [Chelonia mydas]|nr:T-cell receptor alpha chain V region RL-5 [Chelonia mydas]